MKFCTGSTRVFVYSHGYITTPAHAKVCFEGDDCATCEALAQAEGHDRDKEQVVVIAHAAVLALELLGRRDVVEGLDRELANAGCERKPAGLAA